jgi:hypothetical protein
MTAADEGNKGGAKLSVLKLNTISVYDIRA